MTKSKLNWQKIILEDLEPQLCAWFTVADHTSFVVDNGIPGC